MRSGEEPAGRSPARPASGGRGLEGAVEITSEAELRALVGEANPVVFTKAATELGEFEQEWIRHSPFCLIATADAQGACDVSPRGDPPGFVHILDHTTIAIPDRPGNRRLDSWRHVQSNPRVGIVFVIPGRGDTLRVNGRARLVRAAPCLDRMVVRGNRPKLALVVEVEEAYFHCAKAFMRARLWDSDSWRPDAVASRARIAKATEWTDASLASLEQRYGPDYERLLYPERE